jgi:hypothetical protein
MNRTRWIAACCAMLSIIAQVSPADVSSPQPAKKPAKKAATHNSADLAESYIPLGALSGTDADLLAATLSSVFRGKFVITACSDKSSDDSSSGQSTGNAGGDSASSSKHILKIQPWGRSASVSVAKSSSSSNNECSSTAQALPTSNSTAQTPPTQCASPKTDECVLERMVSLLDRDNFKGGVLSSAYVIEMEDCKLASKLQAYFAHPIPDLDVEPFACCQTEAANPSADNTAQPCQPLQATPTYLVLVPTPLVQGQSAAAKKLAQDAAGLNQDFERLKEYSKKFGSNLGGCQNFTSPEMAERCRDDNTIVLQVLDPREVAIRAHCLFSATCSTVNDFHVEVFPLNRAISFVPDHQNSTSNDLEARAVEQFELYRQNEAQQQLITSLQSASATATQTTSQSPTTTTTTKIKTPVPSSGGQGRTNPPAPQAPNAAPAGQGQTAKSAQTSSSTISVSTSTSTTPSGSGSGSSAGQSAGAAAQSSAQGAAASTGGGSGSGGGGGSGSGGGNASGTQAAQAQPTAPSWTVDNIVRLYDYRDAAGVAAAINGMVSYVPNSRPIVQPLSDFGANDMLEILPSAASQGGYNVGDIERAISLLDLPRPQLSLQVWSYQITAKVKHPDDVYKKSKGKCPSPCKGVTEDDDTRLALERIDHRVDLANRKMIRALESGMQAIFLEAKKAGYAPDCSPDLAFCQLSSDMKVDCTGREHNQGSPTSSCPSSSQQPKPDECALDAASKSWKCFPYFHSDPFFDEPFREYLTMKYSDCIKLNHYCLGYFNALDFPDSKSPEQITKFAANASLGRMLLFLVAANDGIAKCLAPHEKTGACQDPVGPIITGMRKALEKDKGDCPEFCPIAACPKKGSCPSDFPKTCKTDCCCYLSRFAAELDRITDPANLRILREAFLDFFFNYKWTLNYPNDFVPYDIRRSAHTLDDLLQPVVNAFNQDVDEYVQDAMDDPSLIPHDSKAGLISRGMVQVAALSGTPATVSGEVMNYFNITQTPPISQALSSTTSGGIPGWATTNPYSKAAAALADILSAPKVEAQLTRGITLQVTPTSLDTADSAELNVNLLVNEPDGSPQSVNSATATQDLLNRVAQHQVTDTVRVQNLKLFDLSTFSMEITHPKMPACLPLDNDDGKLKTAFYYATFPLSVPCVVWRSVFGSVPVAGRLFEWPRQPETVDNRSVAIIRAVVVPTAMDIGESLDFESDRVYDPITGITETLSSVSQLGWRVRQFHRLMMECVVNGKTPGCPAKLSEIPDDTRKPTTN